MWGVVDVVGVCRWGVFVVVVCVECVVFVVLLLFFNGWSSHNKYI